MLRAEANWNEVLGKNRDGWWSEVAGRAQQAERLKGDCNFWWRGR